MKVRRTLHLVLALCFALGAAACESAGEPPAGAASWMSQPFDQWPQIVLTNRAQFSGDRALLGASSFLVTNAHGAVALATARHLLGAPGGIEPPISVDELATALVEWQVHPRTKPKRAIRVGSVAVPGLSAPQRDWLVLHVDDPSELPSLPLRLRRTPVEVGETVYLLGCSYSEPEVQQKVYRGRVTERYYRDFFRFDIDPPVELPGFSGAPILDARGDVVGVMTVLFGYMKPRMSGDRFLEAGGEDVGPELYDAVEELFPYYAEP